MTVWLASVLVLFVCAMVHASILEGWNKRIEEIQEREDPRNGVATDVFVSIIVPARNAATTLVPLLQDLHAQRYPKDRCEVIVVDDGSEDGTAEVVTGMIRAWPQLRLIVLSEGEGKKNAITQGVIEAQGELILLTDADARCGPGRLVALAEHWRRTRADLVLMPVGTLGGDGVVAWLQRAEQFAFQGATAGSALDGAPLLANGTNIAFAREAFFAVGGFQGDRWASGDDMLLLKRMARAKKPVSYLLDADAIVIVGPELDWSGFIAQRLRWAGKMRAYRNTAGFIAGLFAILFPWGLFVFTCLVARNVSIGENLLYTWAMLAGAWLTWTLPIIRLVRSMKRFFMPAGKRIGAFSDALGTLCALAAFAVYAPLIAILAMFIRPKWKGRRV